MLRYFLTSETTTARALRVEDRLQGALQLLLGCRQPFRGSALPTFKRRLRLRDLAFIKQGIDPFFNILMIVDSSHGCAGEGGRAGCYGRQRRSQSSQPSLKVRVGLQKIRIPKFCASASNQETGERGEGGVNKDRYGQERERISLGERARLHHAGFLLRSPPAPTCVIPQPARPGSRPPPARQPPTRYPGRPELPSPPRQPISTSVHGVSDSKQRSAAAKKPATQPGA